jgi:hypothetical protein
VISRTVIRAAVRVEKGVSQSVHRLAVAA